MSAYDKLMQQIGRSTADLSLLASTVRELQLSHDRLLIALKDMVESTGEWNDSVEAILGRRPKSGIDLDKAIIAIEQIPKP